MFSFLFSALNVIFSFFAICTPVFAQTNEQITLTTYYPSPQGSYVELRSRRLALGDNYLSPVAFCWAPAACANVINANADLVVEGNVGIGTIIPSAKLMVQAGQLPVPGVDSQIVSFGADISLMNTHAAQLELNATGGIGTISRLVFSHLADTSASIQSAGNASTSGWLSFSSRKNGGELIERMRIDEDGQVGIGTNAPEAWTSLSIHRTGALHLRLETDSGSPQGPYLDLINTGEVGGRGYAIGSSGTGNRPGRPGVFEIYDSTAGEDWLVIDGLNNGNVGIGTVAPGYKLTVAGTAWCASGSWEVVSDARLKKDIRPLENSLETILKLQGVSFKWIKPENGQTDGLQRGFIAQDVEKIIPEWVKTDSNGYKSLEKVGVEALLVEAIKEQQEEIKNLKAEVEALKAKINPGK